MSVSFIVIFLIIFWDDIFGTRGGNDNDESN